MFIVDSWYSVPLTATGLGGLTPTGAIMAFGGAAGAIPSGWALCNGAAASRTVYAALFSVIGTTYGVGDGSTTFNLPDLRTRVPVGLYASEAEFDTLGETGGHKLLQAHTHGAFNQDATSPAYPWQLLYDANTSFLYYYMKLTSDSTGGGNAQNLQPYIVINYIIKL